MKHDVYEVLADRGGDWVTLIGNLRRIDEAIGSIQFEPFFTARWPSDWTRKQKLIGETQVGSLFIDPTKPRHSTASKKHGVKIESSKNERGDRIYRIAK
jgi:hypothetical protein